MFYKEKGFYISLICGIVCLAAFSFICMNVFSDGSGEQENAVVAQETQAPVMTEVPTATFSPEAEDATTDNVKSEVKEATPAPKKKKAKTTMKNNKTKVEDKLHFDQETGLLWPVEGDILIEYSPEKVVYFPTLSQFKTNPALIIGSKVGESVKSSSSGVVKNIETNDETGTTVTIAIGDDFKVVYGQRGAGDRQDRQTDEILFRRRSKFILPGKAERGNGKSARTFALTIYFFFKIV